MCVIAKKTFVKLSFCCQIYYLISTVRATKGSSVSHVTIYWKHKPNHEIYWFVFARVSLPNDAIVLPVIVAYPGLIVEFTYSIVNWTSLWELGTLTQLGSC